MTLWYKEHRKTLTDPWEEVGLAKLNDFDLALKNPLYRLRESWTDHIYPSGEKKEKE